MLVWGVQYVTFYRWNNILCILKTATRNSSWKIIVIVNVIDTHTIYYIYICNWCFIKSINLLNLLICFENLFPIAAVTLQYCQHETYLILLLLRSSIKLVSLLIYTFIIIRFVQYIDLASSKPSSYAFACYISMPSTEYLLIFVIEKITLRFQNRDGRM